MIFRCAILVTSALIEMSARVLLSITLFPANSYIKDIVCIDTNHLVIFFKDFVFDEEMPANKSKKGHISRSSNCGNSSKDQKNQGSSFRKAYRGFNTEGNTSNKRCIA